ncbi:MAG: FdhF/YdeP family oxidoreductase [Sumerlaeia bacterium]
MSSGKVEPYTGPAGGLGAIRNTMRHTWHQGAMARTWKSLWDVNQDGGFDCPGCAWPDPADRGAFEFCENGAKAIAAETTGRRADPDFFARHSVAELMARTDHWLEDQGRLTHPMRYDAETDRYQPVTWEAAFALIGKTLRGLDTPDDAIFYTSGRTSNEAAFLYQLLGRAFGTNNFPDCSNMCHESSGTALTASIGIGKGTVTLDDFELADAIFVVGQNPGTNHPRMLTELQKAARRGARIVAINPLKERGLISFAHPKQPFEVLAGKGTAIANHYLQPLIGGDLALFHGLAKALLEMEDEGEGGVLDAEFIADHTQDFEAFAAAIHALDWAEIEAQSGLSRAAIVETAEIYARAERSIICWAMGLTQHEHAVATIQAVMNVLLMRGNIGRPGAGACPVRGHSNVQGDRTVGIVERPKPEFLKRLGEVFHFAPPQHHGLDTLAAIEAMAEGRAKVFIAMGGNFAAATPDRDHTWAALRRCELTVQVSTKLNRGHLVHGREALILPCLGRTEIDLQNGEPQRVTVEDSMSMVHASVGKNRPASEHLLSEPAIVAGMAEATLDPNPAMPWDAMRRNYGLIRDKIAEVLPAFADYNEKIDAPGGFHLRNSAREREWRVSGGRARFVFEPIPDLTMPDGQLRLMTIRSHDQYNTTIYGNDDRYRGIYGTRMVVFVNAEDAAERGLPDGDVVTLRSFAKDGKTREAGGFRVVVYDIPKGCAAAYFPETNVLVPAGSFAKGSRTPVSKFIPIEITKKERDR